LRRLVFLAWVLTGCSVTIPVVVPVPSEKALRGREVEVCRLDSEVKSHFLLVAVDELSLATWRQVIGSVVVKHPRGTMVIDPTFGREIGEDLRRAPLWFRLVMGDGFGKAAIGDLLQAGGIEDHDVRFVALTHSHWDHASGLRDLPWTKVLLSRTELTQIRKLKGHLDLGAIPHHFEIDQSRYKPFEFDGPPVLGFDRSHDLFGDQSVIAVPLPGHTPGSTGYLLSGVGGRRWLLIGDAAWSVEGVVAPVGKSPIPSMLVDGDRQATAQTLGLLHAIREQNPDVVIVPAHDLTAAESIPACAK
jgi:glyoxylase-like metal-dependent hydrolase (beta-lactamase superfamily II)